MDIHLLVTDSEMVQPPPEIRNPERPPPTPNISPIKLQHPTTTKATSSTISIQAEAHNSQAKNKKKMNIFSSLIGKSNDTNEFFTLSRGNEEDATKNALPVQNIIRSHDDTGRNTLEEAGTTNPASFVDTSTQCTASVNCFGETLTHKKHKCVWPDNVITIITNIAQSKSPKLKGSIFQFKISGKAAEENWLTLNKFENLGAALEADNKSFTRYGSEFRSTAILSSLLQNHPLWPRLASILDNGIKFFHWNH